MPWDGCELHVADLAPDGSLTDVEHVAGKDGDESIWQPEWSPSGDLVFASDRSGWWNLERIRDGERAVLHAAEAEFGYPAWVFGMSSFAFLGDGRIFCAYDSGGFTHFARPRPGRRRSRGARPRVSTRWARPTCRPRARGPSSSRARRRPCRIGSRGSTSRAASAETLRTSIESPVSTAYFSTPRSIEFPTEGGLTAYALLLSAHEPRLRRAGGRASAADRREPRRADRERERRLQPRRPVLDEPRLRRSSTSTTAARPVTAARTASG